MGSGGDIAFIVSPPPRCSARRKPTLWERAKFVLLGRECGFDPFEEPRCAFYCDHLQFGHNNPRQAMHEDLTGKRWL